MPPALYLHLLLAWPFMLWKPSHPPALLLLAHLAFKIATTTPVQELDLMWLLFLLPLLFWYPSPSLWLIHKDLDPSHPIPCAALAVPAPTLRPVWAARAHIQGDLGKVLDLDFP